MLYIMFEILLKTIPRSRENASRNFGSLKFSNELRISNKSPQNSRDSDPSSLRIRNHTVSSFTPLTSSYIPPQVNLSTLSTSFLALSTFTTISFPFPCQPFPLPCFPLSNAYIPTPIPLSHTPLSLHPGDPPLDPSLLIPSLPHTLPSQLPHPPHRLTGKAGKGR